MNNEELKTYLYEMIEQIDDNKVLNRIFQFVYKYFLRR